MVIDGICLKWRGSGFGNALIMAQLTGILASEGINAVYGGHSKTEGLVDVPLWTKANKGYLVYNKGFPSTYMYKCFDVPVLVMYLEDISRIVRFPLRFKRRLHGYIPVIYEDIASIPQLDVAMNTETGEWSPYRNWPYFSELKAMLDKEGTSYIDLNSENKMGIECLNYVRKSKVYLGLETGMSHYVSKYANGKAIILQSGFVPFFYWAYPYDYTCISANINCVYRPCSLDRKFIASGVGCIYDHICMKEITPDIVLEAVLRRLR